MLHMQGDLLQMYSSSTSVSWLIIQSDSSTDNEANETLDWRLWHKSIIFFSLGVAEERSNSHKIERGLLHLNWACILRLFLVKGKSSELKSVLHIFKGGWTYEYSCSQQVKTIVFSRRQQSPGKARACDKNWSESPHLITHTKTYGK